MAHEGEEGAGEGASSEGEGGQQQAGGQQRRRGTVKLLPPEKTPRGKIKTVKPQPLMVRPPVKQRTMAKAVASHATSPRVAKRVTAKTNPAAATPKQVRVTPPLTIQLAASQGMRPKARANPSRGRARVAMASQPPMDVRKTANKKLPAKNLTTQTAATRVTSVNH